MDSIFELKARAYAAINCYWVAMSLPAQTLDLMPSGLITPAGSYAAQVNGRAVFGKYCATCHTLKASNAVGKVGPNLDILHPPKGLILDAIANGRARGQGQMPAGLVDGQDAQDEAAYVAAVAGQQW